LRVALLTNFVPPYRVSLFEALARRVDRLLVLTSTEMEPGRPWPFAPGSVDVIVQKTLTLQQSQRGQGFRDQVALHVPLDTTERLEAFAPDVIVSGELGARTLAATRFGQRHHVPVVVWATLSERSERHRGRARRWVRSRLLRAAEHVLVNGASGERYVRGFGVPPQHITRVPYTTAMEAFLSLPPARARPTDAPLRVLSVGSLIARKAPDALLAGAQRAASAERPIELTFVGDGPLRGALERRASLPAPGLSVRFAGAVQYGALPRYYAEADVLAFPTLSDEWGLVVNEALAAGVPVLGSRESQAVEELIVDGGNGWLLDDCTAQGIARGLQRVLRAAPARFASMRGAARSSVTGLEPQAAADKMHRVLAGLTAAGVR
jgi:glycosyltransferase involved in cell wall biosynthesis